jgi:hypothetical protein
METLPIPIIKGIKLNIIKAINIKRTTGTMIMTADITVAVDTTGTKT